jgi:hypothetical protein
MMGDPDFIDECPSLPRVHPCPGITVVGCFEDPVFSCCEKDFVCEESQISDKKTAEPCALLMPRTTFVRGNKNPISIRASEEIARGIDQKASDEPAKWAVTLSPLIGLSQNRLTEDQTK